MELEPDLIEFYLAAGVFDVGRLAVEVDVKRLESIARTWVDPDKHNELIIGLADLNGHASFVVSLSLEHVDERGDIGVCPVAEGIDRSGRAFLQRGELRGAFQLLEGRSLVNSFELYTIGDPRRQGHRHEQKDKTPVPAHERKIRDLPFLMQSSS
jgi:hypothetical protein